MKRTFFILALLTLFGFSLAPQPAAAKKKIDLPPLPAQDILNKVISETGGPTYAPLNAPNFVVQQLAVNFDGVFQGVENRISLFDTVSYIKTNAALAESVLPLSDSATAVLDPDITAPGAEPRPGKVVGALFQPARGVMVIVAVFKADKPGEAPEKVRFYTNSNNYYEYSIRVGQFQDPEGDGAVNQVDAGGLIAYQYTCVTVGVEQMCWDPYDYGAVREEPTPKDIAYAAHTRFKDTYKFKANFHVDDALPDLIGAGYRTNCAIQFSTATNFNVLPAACTPNLVFSSSKEKKPEKKGEYIVGLFVVRQTADLKAYTPAGAYVGAVPAGEYLLIDATPGLTTDGAVGVFYLVNADTVNHYLIPSRVLQGFGQSSAIDKTYAAIKDGFAWYRSF